MNYKLMGLSLSCVLAANLSAFTLEGGSKILAGGAVSLDVEYAQKDESLIAKKTAGKGRKLLVQKRRKQG